METLLHEYFEYVAESGDIVTLIYLSQGPLFTAVFQEWAPWLFQVCTIYLSL